MGSVGHRGSESVHNPSLNILFINIRSVFNKVEALETLLYEDKPDILCLAETWLSNDKNVHFKINKYSKLTDFYRTNRIGGGVAIFINVDSNIKVNPINKLKSMSVEEVFECCGVIVTSNKLKYILLNVYRPPDRNNYFQFIDLLDSTLSLLRNEFYELGLPLVLCGDLNIDNLVETWDKEYFKDVMDSYNLNITFRNVTRTTYNNRPSQLDYFLTDLDSKMYSVSVLPPILSDHNPIVFKIYTNVARKLERKVEKRKINKSNLTLFERLLSLQLWPKDGPNIDVNSLFNDFYSTFIYIFDVCFPKAICKVKDDSHVKWITEEIMTSQDHLKELYWNTRKTPNNIIAKQEYNRAKYQHANLLTDSKKQFYKAKLDNSSNISKESWKVVKNLTCDENVNNSNISLKTNDELITNPSNVANIFNNYFVEEIKKLTEQDNDGTERVQVRNQYNFNFGDFRLWPTTITEVREVIDKVSAKSSAGIDEIPCSILKVCKEIVAEPLVLIINKSFETGCFPSRIKTSKVVPIHKGKEKDIVGNYRPVAVQSVFSKVIEITFLRRLMPYLNNKNLLTDNQYGFRKHLSTTDAIFDLLIQIYDKLDLVGDSLCLFYDMTKAFDLLSHKVLVDKLIALGIKGKPLNWIVAYLKDRKQVVNVRHTGQDGLTRHYRSSESPNINTGVPQGSNLGPVLFILYVNDLPDSITEGKVWLFADDVSQFLYQKDKELLRGKAQLGLDEMSAWCKENKLLLNKGKTKVLTLHNRRKPESNPLLRLDGSSIAIVDSVKYLGITISSDLRWQQHIDSISSRLSAVCYMVRRLQPIVEKDVLMKVYFGCFHSIMKYGIVFWGNSPMAQRIFLLQKRVIRIICKAHYVAHCKDLFLQLRILTLPALFILECALMVRKNPQIFITNEEIHNYSTRQKYKIHMSAVKSSQVQSGPRYTCTKIYNKVPVEIRNVDSDVQFKSALKDFLTTRPYYSTEEYFNRE